MKYLYYPYKIQPVYCCQYSVKIWQHYYVPMCSLAFHEIRYTSLFQGCIKGGLFLFILISSAIYRAPLASMGRGGDKEQHESHFSKLEAKFMYLICFFKQAARGTLISSNNYRRGHSLIPIEKRTSNYITSPWEMQYARQKVTSHLRHKLVYKFHNINIASNQAD